MKHFCAVGNGALAKTWRDSGASSLEIFQNLNVVLGTLLWMYCVQGQKNNLTVMGCNILGPPKISRVDKTREMKRAKKHFAQKIELLRRANCGKKDYSLEAIQTGRHCKQLLLSLVGCSCNKFLLSCYTPP